MNSSLPPEQRDRPHLIKRIRKAAQQFQIAVYLIAIIGMAILVNSLMNGFGGGGSSDALISVGDTASQVTIDQPDENVDPEAPQTTTRTDVITLLIEEERYQIAVGDGYKEIGLEEIANRVKAIPGNSDGVKVIVQRKKSAREVAQLKLRETLDKLITKEAQRWPDKLVE